jgi:hypothetical protein
VSAFEARSPEFNPSPTKKKKKKKKPYLEIEIRPIILAVQETEIRRIKVRSQPRQVALETLSQKEKKKSQKRTGGVAQGVGPEFKPL